MRTAHLAILASILIADCSGGSTTLSDRDSSPAGHALTTAAVTVRITVPQAKAAVRKPAFISPATQSFSITVTNAGQSYGPFVTNCSGGSCVETVDAPLGADVFTVSLYGQQNAGGTLLSSGAADATIVAGGNQVVSITFDPVVASAKVSTSLSALEGVPATVPISIAALDPSGATIVAPGAYEDSNGNPVSITLTLSDPSATSTLAGQTSYASPAPAAATPAASLLYNGTAPTNFTYPTIDVSIGGRQRSSVLVPLLPRAVASPVALVASGFTIDSATRGSDGNVWFTASGRSASEIGKFDVATGAVTTYALKNATAAPNDIVAGSDGDLYFFENGTTSFGQITTSGSLREYPESFSASSLVNGVDGSIWFLTQNDIIGKISTGGVATVFSSSPVAIALSNGPNGKMWYLAQSGDQYDLGNIASDGTLDVAVPVAVIEPGEASGLWYAPDGNFYTETDFTTDGSSSVGFTSTGAVAPNACIGGDFAGSLFDGADLFIAGKPTNITGYSAIRVDGACVEVATRPGQVAFFNPLYYRYVGISAGHAYAISTTGTIVPFEY